jgi:hypothetical protein
MGAKTPWGGFFDRIFLSKKSGFLVVIGGIFLGPLSNFFFTSLTSS